jgi:hypothetical protein
MTTALMGCLGLRVLVGSWAGQSAGAWRVAVVVRGVMRRGRSSGGAGASAGDGSGGGGVDGTARLAAYSKKQKSSKVSEVEGASSSIGGWHYPLLPIVGKNVRFLRKQARWCGAEGGWEVR